MKKLIDNVGYTDKNTGHSYFPLYEELLNPIADSAINILEIGIGDFFQSKISSEKNGGSLLMWSKFFTKAKIHGVDILGEDFIHEQVLGNDRIITYTNTNAYSADNVKKNFIDKNIKFDLVLDDGPHSLESMKSCIELYHNLLTPSGILIIEDVQDIEWFKELSNTTPDYLKKHIKTYDLRANKNRRDDLVFTINKIK